MAVVIKNATKGFILDYDGLNEKTRVLDLQKQFNENTFDIKLLDRKGVDITVSGNAFVSDIVFTGEQNEMLSLDYYKKEENFKRYNDRFQSIMKRDYPNWNWKINWIVEKNMKTVDYNDPLNWALTYKMRGFTDLHSKVYAENHKIENCYTASLIKVLMRHCFNEHSDEESDDGIYDFNQSFEDDFEHEKLRNKYFEEKDKVDQAVDYFCKLKMNLSCGWVYVEHEPTTKEINIEAKEREPYPGVLKPSRILDFYEKGSESYYGTAIEIGISPQLTDYIAHSDEGTYSGGVNYYNKNEGIVLTGEQNRIMYYGTAQEENIYIPDVFYEPI